LPIPALPGGPGAGVSAGPADFCLFGGGERRERGELAFPGQGGELGQGIDETANVILDPRDEPFRDAPPVAGRNRVDQCHHSGTEALGRGKGWGVGHGNMLV
jgi:hypothetical protein